MYPSGFQVHRTSHSNIDEWVAAGYDKKYITSYLNSQFGSYNHPNRAVEPRIPGIFQYYSIAEDELTKIFAGKVRRADRRQQHRRSVGKADRPDRSREADRALQGVARRVVSLHISSGGSSDLRLVPSRGTSRAFTVTGPKTKSAGCDLDAEFITGGG